MANADDVANTLSEVCKLFYSQSIAINEITSSLFVFEQVVQKNTKISETGVLLAENLKSQSNLLTGTISDIIYHR